MKKAVLFDLDNTLYAYEPAHNAGLEGAKKILKQEINLAYKKFDTLYELSKKEIYRELSGTASAHNKVLHFQRLIEKTHNTVDPRIVLKLYDAYWNNFLKKMKLRKGAMHVLKTLKKQNLKIAIVSDLTTHIQLRKLKKLKIDKYVDILVTSEEAGSEKPHAIMFLLTLNKLNLKPTEVFFVGDDLIKDMEGANSVGIDSVYLTKSKVKLANPDYRKPNYVIREITELLDLINSKKGTN